MPETAQMVDEWRAVFGPNTTFTRVREGDIERGKPSAPVRTMDADQWLRYVKTGEVPAGMERPECSA